MKISLDDLSGPRYVGLKLAGHDSMLVGNHTKLLN
jgi:hypothetical protein